MADPAEVLGGAQEVVDGGADLRGGGAKRRHTRGPSDVSGPSVEDTYREEHHGDGEGDGGQHSQAHDEQEHVSLVDLGVGVQQLGLHMHCG